MFSDIGIFAKALFASLMAALTALYVSLDGDNFNLSDKDWLNIAIAVATAVGVYVLPNSRKSEV